MATRKNTKSSTRTASGSRKSASRQPSRQPSRRAQRREERSTLGASLLLCGLGLLFVAFILVRGANVWQTLRGTLFGLFGLSAYLIGPLLLVLGYLVAKGYLVGRFTLKVLLMAILCGSVPVVFSGFTIREETAWEIIKMLFAWSQAHFWSGGVLGGLLGAPLLALCGRPAANILLLLIFAIGLMFFFAVTPLDVVQFAAYYWQQFQQRREAARAEREEYDVPLFENTAEEEPAGEPTEVRPVPARRARQAPPERRGPHHDAFNANPYIGGEETEPAAAPAPAPVVPAPTPAMPETPAPVPPAPPRADFDVDLGPSMEQQSLQKAVEHDPLEPVIIGPGGTFGLDPLKELGKPKTPPAPAPAPAPAADEFEQHIEESKPEPAADAGADELDDLIQKAMSAPYRAAAPTIAEDDFDTTLEPQPGPRRDPLPDTVYVGEDTAMASAAQLSALLGQIEPAPSDAAAPAAVQPTTAPESTAGPVTLPGGVPALAGSIDPARAAWNAGIPLTAAYPAAPADEVETPLTAQTGEAGEETEAGDLLEMLGGHPGNGGRAVRYRPAAAAPAADREPAPAPEPTADAAGEKAPEPAEPEEEESFPEPRPYAYPSLDLFNASRPEDEAGAEQEMRHNADVLVSTLDSFGVKTRILDICRGPSVTRYELQPQAGIKVSRITSLSDDIALNLATAGVRIEAPIPGKPAVGIEVPNKIRTTVNIRTVFESQNYINMRSPLTMALGKDIAGTAQVADLCKMPHLLIAGSTGSGKSVCVNSIIISFLFRSSPEDVKLILIDPKVVELAEYNGIPHLLMPVVTEPRKAAGALGASVQEMERRYKLFADNNVREIKAYNKLAAQRPDELEHLPYIAIVIDELADLMMVAGKEVEDSICRIAQKARAAGIHLIVATQRPSVDVITGLIKANIPSRIAFAVSSQVDSRTILDSVGAEKLLGNGDMLFLPVGAPKPTRVQGTFVTDEEIAAVLNFIKSTSDAQYDEEMIAEMERRAVAEKGAKKDAAEEETDSTHDAMFDQAVECVIEAGLASTSLLQRRCKLGYARAARIMDQMEREKIIGPYEGAKPRTVLVTMAQWQERKLGNHG